MNSYKIVATIIGLLFSLAIADAAQAEDGSQGGYGYQAVQQVQPAQQADSNYVVPPSYQGQYYPQETESVVGYHGTTNTSSNTAGHGEDPYYMYYY